MDGVYWALHGENKWQLQVSNSERHYVSNGVGGSGDAVERIETWPITTPTKRNVRWWYIPRKEAGSNRLRRRER
jgi:hypothetical protein